MPANAVKAEFTNHTRHADVEFCGNCCTCTDSVLLALVILNAPTSREQLAGKTRQSQSESDCRNLLPPTATKVAQLIHVAPCCSMLIHVDPC